MSGHNPLSEACIRICVAILVALSVSRLSDHGKASITILKLREFKLDFARVLFNLLDNVLLRVALLATSFLRGTSVQSLIATYNLGLLTPKLLMVVLHRLLYHL